MAAIRTLLLQEEKAVDEDKVRDWLDNLLWRVREGEEGAEEGAEDAGAEEGEGDGVAIALRRETFMILLLKLTLWQGFALFLDIRCYVSGARQAGCRRAD